MVSLVTVSHYKLPYALVEQYNGREGREVIDCFLRYCKANFARYQDKVKLWLTLPFGAILNTGTIPTTAVPDNKHQRRRRSQIHRGQHHLRGDEPVFEVLGLGLAD